MLISYIFGVVYRIIAYGLAAPLAMMERAAASSTTRAKAELGHPRIYSVVKKNFIQEVEAKLRGVKELAPLSGGTASNKYGLLRFDSLGFRFPTWHIIIEDQAQIRNKIEIVHWKISNSI